MRVSIAQRHTYARRERERLTEAFIAAFFFLLLRTNNDQSILHFAL